MNGHLIWNKQAMYPSNKSNVSTSYQATVQMRSSRIDKFQHKRYKTKEKGPSQTQKCLPVLACPETILSCQTVDRPRGCNLCPIFSVFLHSPGINKNRSRKQTIVFLHISSSDESHKSGGKRVGRKSVEANQYLKIAMWLT